MSVGWKRKRKEQGLALVPGADCVSFEIFGVRLSAGPTGDSVQTIKSIVHVDLA